MSAPVPLTARDRFRLLAANILRNFYRNAAHADAEQADIDTALNALDRAIVFSISGQGIGGTDGGRS